MAQLTSIAAEGVHLAVAGGVVLFAGRFTAAAWTAVRHANGRARDEARARRDGLVGRLWLFLGVYALTSLVAESHVAAMGFPRFWAVDDPTGFGAGYTLVSFGSYLAYLQVAVGLAVLAWQRDRRTTVRAGDVHRADTLTAWIGSSGFVAALLGFGALLLVSLVHAITHGLL